MARRVITVLAAAALTLTTAAPAHANPTDESFLTALRDAGIGYDDPATAIDLGQQVCPLLVKPGQNFASVATRLRGNNGISPEMASFFTGIAISMYCPQMITSISDGSVLNNLSLLNNLGILGDIGPTNLSGLSGLMR